MKIDVVTIIQFIAILIVGGFVAWQKVKEIRLTKKYNLDENPERCEKHSTALTELKGDVERIKEDIKEIKRDIRELRGAQ